MHPINEITVKPLMKDEHPQQTDSWSGSTSFNGAPFAQSVINGNVITGPGGHHSHHQFGPTFAFFQPTAAAVFPYPYPGNPQGWNDNAGRAITAYQQQQHAHHQSAGHYPIDAMFGSHNSYRGYNSTYGNAPFYPPPSSNPDQFWGNKQQPQQQQNPVNYRNQDAAIANDSLYGYQNNNGYPEQSLDGSLNHVEAGLSGLNIDSRQSEDFGPPSFASIGSRKTTSWASIASQPAKSQPKSLKSKMAASGLTGSTSKHLPPTVTMDAMSWESKAKSSMANAVSGGKSMPPPAVIAAAAPSIPPPIVPANTTSPVEEFLPSPPVIQPAAVAPQQQPSPPQRPLNHVSKENSWTSNGNSSSSGSISTSVSSPRPSQAPILPKVVHHNNGNTGGMRAPIINEINENYNPNKYVNNNQRNNHYNNNISSSSNNNYSTKPLLDNPPPYPSRNSSSGGYPAAGAGATALRDVPQDISPPHVGKVSEDMTRAELEKLFDENDYNPKEFDLAPRNARFFIIKSYSEDDVHRSIKYSIWCSTDHGNKRLDTAFRQQEDKGPIYLFYSVNRSGHFCGIAQMMSPVDYNASSGVWAQDKWKGQFQVKWIYVKDVPNDELRHITLENNENKPVTNSRDTQEVPYEKGKKVLAIIHKFEHRTSIFDDFLHYEKKQEEEQRKPDSPPPPVNPYPKMANPQFNSTMPPRDTQMPFRGGNGNNFGNKNRSYPEPRGEPRSSDPREPRNDFRNDYRGGSDYRSERGEYRNDRMDRPPADYGRERNMEHRGSEYRDNHVREGREYREYREHREPQFHRDQYHRDFHAPPPPRDYGRERNEYRPQERDHRDFRDHRDQRVPHERHQQQQQSWRN